uniref:GEVED domain-containing protein n=1 Tax=Mesonia mobilis TaxID=369791 RepID=UPI0026EB4716
TYSFTIDECGLCESNGNLASNVSNTLVDFNSINNSTSTTKTSGYSDFTNLSTNLAKESSYPLTVNVFTDGNNLTTTTVWIDWNQDCVFSSDEMYNLGTNQNQNNVSSSISPLSITVPQSALLGETIMRVSTKVTSAANACEKDFDGEVEDYTVIVTDELSTSSNELADSFAIYPNPNQGEFTVSLRSENPSPIDINVFDITGRRIFNQSYEYQHDFSQNLRLNQAQAGVYFVKVSNGNNNVTKKVIVE